jgi:predicted ABC-type ATPase
MISSASPVIVVLAGVNGAGKSSIGGAILHQSGLAYFNPDEAAQRIRETLRCSVEEANSFAWHEGKRRLASAIESRSSFALESTLGGSSIPRLLKEAAEAGIEVLVWFVGLSSADQHIARVRARVAAGGHDIPKAKIRERWETSRRNLIDLLPSLSELKLFDNSREGDPATGTIPPPRLLLHCRSRTIIAPPLSVLERAPEWARPIIARALQLQRLARETSRE